MMNKLFNTNKMSWTRVIVFALVCALYTALVCVIPFLVNTSFNDIAVYLEWWFLFALIIIMNCETTKEAALKCFVFFLISQPLIYLFQVPFNDEGFKIFRYYRYWFVITLLTIPGSIIAFQIKKQNLISALVLSVASIYMGYQAIVYLKMALSNFPYHILSCLACIFLGLYISFALIKNNKLRLIPIVALIVSLLVASFINNIWKKDGYCEVKLPDGNWTYTIDDPYIVSLDINEDNVVRFKTEGNGLAYVCFTNENNDIEEYYINVNGNSIFASVVK